MDDDIEFLDIDNLPKRSERNQEPKNDDDKKIEDKKEKKKEEVKEVKKDKKEKKEKKVKVKKPLSKTSKIIYLSIIILSVLFLGGCLYYYGNRFITYYRIYNPKPTASGERRETLANYIPGHSAIVYEGDGLYSGIGEYIYKGVEVNNYIKYNNLLWRIVSIGTDNTIQIVLDKSINLLPYGTKNVKYSETELNKYLNDTFLNEINKEHLVKMNYCNNFVSALNDMDCYEYTDSYVSLLDITSYLNSLNDNKTYINDEETMLWLRNVSSDKAWHTNEYSVSLSDITDLYQIRPVVKLKNTLFYKDGDGTLEKPFEFDETINGVTIGSYVQIKDDKYVVYSTKNNIMLMSDSYISQKYFSQKEMYLDINNKTNIAYYLNNDFYNELPYKDKLIKNDYSTGEYNKSFDDVDSKTINAYVSVPNMKDIKFNTDSTLLYFVSTKINDGMLVTNGNDYYFNSPRYSRNIRYCITISKDSELSGKGTYEDPYVLVVE